MFMLLFQKDQSGEFSKDYKYNKYMNIPTIPSINKIDINKRG